jgi:predicted RNase H-like HicB family nuclease
MEEFVLLSERGGPGEENWGACVPDLPGRISTGETSEAVPRNIREAIELHLAGLKAKGLPVPEPTTQAGRVVVAV